MKTAQLLDKGEPGASRMREIRGRYFGLCEAVEAMDSGWTYCVMMGILLTLAPLAFAIVVFCFVGSSFAHISTQIEVNIRFVRSPSTSL